MELHNLTFSPNIRFSVTDIEDYNIKGSFDPNASCDTEFFGYRETSFTVSQIESYDNRLAVWTHDSDDTVRDFKNYFDDRITLIVQNAIDDKQGDL